MQSFKLTPRPRGDFRLEIDEIRKLCTLEKHGYRHNKIIYGFCDKLPDLALLQSRGLAIEAISFDKARLTLAYNLVERGRAKSKLDHLLHDQVENGVSNEQDVAAQQQKLADLNNAIQAAKEALGITGTLITLKF